MEANIRYSQYPDMGFIEEYVNLQGYQFWLRHDDAPPFGKFEYLESFVKPDDELDHHVEYQFNIYLRMPHAHIVEFMEGIELRGWKEIQSERDAHPLLDIKETNEKKYEDPSEKQALGKFGQGKSKVNTKALLKAFERTFEVGLTKNVSTYDPELCVELEQRARSD